MSNVMLSCGCRANSVNMKTGEPSCVIHSDMPGGVHPIPAPDLTGRKARCHCGNTRNSSLDLAFFEFRGPGSREGTESCKNCGYHRVAHTLEIQAKNDGICKNFESIGSYEFDEYYCGCDGWD